MPFLRQREGPAATFGFQRRQRIGPEGFRRRLLPAVRLRMPIIMADRFFNLEEAERMLPQIEQLLKEAVASKKAAEAAEEEVNRARGQIMMLGGSLPDRAKVAQRMIEKDESANQLQSAMQRITDSGCLVKDLDTGLVDFPCLWNDREVYLCWKLGEPHIEFWHNVEDGFAGRRPVDQEFLKKIQGPRPN